MPEPTAPASMPGEVTTASAVTSPPTYEEVTDWLRANHLVTVSGHTWWTWDCQCGKSGVPTTEGRAKAGRDRHLKAQRRAYKETP